MSVRCIKLEEHWRKHFGDTRCHVLKVEIEGSELEFLKTEQSFLKLVDSILLEWHKWRVSLDAVSAFAGYPKIQPGKVLEENEQMETTYFLVEGLARYENG